MIDMETVKIYLSGAMSGISWEEQTKWRQQIKNAIKFGDYDYEKCVTFFDPTQYYNFEERHQKSEKEVMEFDLYNLRNSDLVIANLDNNGDKSIGTSMELMLAKELRIPVIAFGGDKETHPWISETCLRMCNNVREAVEYVVGFYLN